MDSAFPNETRRPDGSRGFRGNSENAKTRLCTRWLQGDCRFGERCNFAHGEAELRKGDRIEGAPGGYGQGPMPGRGGGRGGGYPARGGMGMGPGGYPGPGRGGRGMYGGDMGYGGGYGGGYGMPQQGYGGPMGEPGRPAHLPEDVWAAQGYPVAGPNGWYMYRTKDAGESYFHNHRTNQTIWERPPEWPAAGPGQM